MYSVFNKSKKKHVMVSESVLIHSTRSGREHAAMRTAAIDLLPLEVL